MIETKEDILLRINNLEKRINGIKIYINKETRYFPAIGYYFDNKSLVWKVFETNERHNSYIYLETKNELDALNELYKLVLGEYKIQQRNQQIENQK